MIVLLCRIAAAREREALVTVMMTRAISSFLPTMISIMTVAKRSVRSKAPLTRSTRRRWNRLYLTVKRRWKLVKS